MPVVSNFVLNPAKHVLPAYRISPFTTKDVSFNHQLAADNKIDDYFTRRFPGKRIVYCESGRAALGIALEHLGMGNSSHVAILTTSQNFYISGCVTGVIEKYCRWSRTISGDTSCLLINHEFGFAYESSSQLLRYGLPVIEDACLSFASDNAERSLGRVGAMTIFSFPKFFPIQIGGLLVCDPKYNIQETVPPETKRYIQKVLSYHIGQIDWISEKRRLLFKQFAKKFALLGFLPRFDLQCHSIPGVFMFKTDARVDLAAMKTFMNAHGVESSVFYGENAFYLPLNQRMDENDVNYLYELTVFFLRR